MSFLSAFVLIAILVFIHEFGHFIGDNIRLDPVMLDEDKSIEELLSFYMGKNTPDRQSFIIDNLKVELDIID